MSKKLVYISNNRMPIELAHGLQVMSMCEAFVENNMEVELIIPMRVNPIKDDSFSYYGIKKTFLILKIPCFDLIFISGKNIFFWIQTMTFLFFSKIFLLFKKYDLLYTREQLVGLFWKDFVLEIHSLPKKVRPMHKKIWNKSKALIVLTSFIKERLVGMGVSHKKIYVAPDGVNISVFDIDISKESAREKVRLPQNKKLIGYVGMLKTLGMEKGIDSALKALAMIRDEDIMLVLVGGYAQDIEIYKKLVGELNISQRVIFVGRVPHTEIPLYLKAFDILVSPFPENEHYSFYMSPMKIFEYMASKRPIVSTDLPSLREVLGTGEAIFVPPGNIEILADELSKAANNINKYDEIAHKAFERVSNLTWKKRAKNILGFLKS